MLIPVVQGDAERTTLSVKFLLNDPEAPTEPWRQAASDGEERTVSFFVFLFGLFF